MTNTSPSALSLGRVRDIGKALANSTRLRLLAMLHQGELCVCQLTAVVNLAPSTVSEHLTELRRAGLVTEQKRGRWVHYRLARDGQTGSVAAQLIESLERDPQIEADALKVTAMRNVPVGELCRSGFDVSRTTRPTRKAPAVRRSAVSR